MSTTVRRFLLIVCALAPLVCVLARSDPASADSFGSTYYDRSTNELVVTMRYMGTNPNHKFTLQWGSCQPADSDSIATVDVAVLDDQFEDAAQQDYQTVERFSLGDMRCQRPVTVMLYTAPRVSFPLLIPE
jgi:hypothetical protein